jgi:hypothetical protein
MHTRQHVCLIRLCRIQNWAEVIKSFIEGYLSSRINPGRHGISSLTLELKFCF